MEGLQQGEVLAQRPAVLDALEGELLARLVDTDRVLGREGQLELVAVAATISRISVARVRAKSRALR